VTAAMPPTASAPSPAIRRAAVQRGVGMALLAMAALTWAGALAIDEDIRGWTTAGIAVAAVIDGAIGLYFLRVSSQP
jgi:hypothetical protein